MPRFRRKAIASFKAADSNSVMRSDTVAAAFSVPSAFFFLKSVYPGFHFRAAFTVPLADFFGYARDFKAFDNAFVIADVFYLVSHTAALRSKFVLIDFPGVANGVEHFAGIKRKGNDQIRACRFVD